MGLALFRPSQWCPGESKAAAKPLVTQKPHWFGITLPNCVFQPVFVIKKTSMATLSEKADFQIVLFFSVCTSPG